MSYENAPATQMLNSHCVCCHRPLVDSVSVECGIGPVCRDKYGYSEAVNEENRSQANKIVAGVARQGTTQEERKAAYDALQALGFVKLASAVLYVGKAPVIKLRESTKRTGFYVTAPYNASALSAWRNVPGRRWAAETKENFVPFGPAGEKALQDLLESYYPGAEIQTILQDVDFDPNED